VLGRTGFDALIQRNLRRERPARCEEIIGSRIDQPNGDARYVRRDENGQFSESDDVGRSQKANRTNKARACVGAQSDVQRSIPVRSIPLGNLA
jgi:hypothetical protein